MSKLNFPIFSRQILKNPGSLWLELTGSPSNFPLESRIFHSISIGLIFLACIYVPYNLYAGLYIGSVSAFVIALFFLHQYYHSRFHQKPHNNTAFALVGVVIFGLNYFANSGIDGSTDLIWPAYLLVVFAISPYQQHLKWLILYIVFFLIVHLIEHAYPEFVRHPFTAGRGQFIDRVTAFPMPVVAIYIIIKYLRKSYDIERKAAREKTITLESNKAQILAQKDLLEQSNMEKSKLMSILSHDLRTPLSNIQGYLGMLNDHQIDGNDRRIVETALLSSTNSAMEMLSNLLHWSKSQMDGHYVQIREVDLLSTLTATLEMGKIHAMNKGISLAYQVPSSLIVLADVDMLQLVTRNLITNAVKFTPAGGKILIEVQLLPGECKITVTDNGKGIPEDKWDKIFSIKSEPALGTNNERGVGLGLVLCKEYIELQNGRIGFESTSGQGSVFFIYIPLPI